MKLELVADIEVKERKRIETEMDIDVESLVDYCDDMEPINREELILLVLDYLDYDDKYLIEDAISDEIMPNEDTTWDTENYEFKNLPELIDLIESKIEYSNE